MLTRVSDRKSCTSWHNARISVVHHDAPGSQPGIRITASSTLTMGDWTTAVAPKNPILSADQLSAATIVTVRPANVAPPLTLNVVSILTASSTFNVPKTVVVAPVCPMFTVPLSALPANAVVEDVPNPSTVLAVFAVIALA